MADEVEIDVRVGGQDCTWLLDLARRGREWLLVIRGGERAWSAEEPDLFEAGRELGRPRASRGGRLSRRKTVDRRGRTIDADRSLSHVRWMTAIRVRSAVAGDRPALRRIFRRASLSNAGDRDVLLAHPDALELPDSGVPDGRTRVAMAADGTVVGFISSLWGNGSALEVEDLVVDPDWMRRGVARRLVGDLVETARLAGIARIEVTANPHADGFYRSRIRLLG